MIERRFDISFKKKCVGKGASKSWNSSLQRINQITFLPFAFGNTCLRKMFFSI